MKRGLGMWRVGAVRWLAAIARHRRRAVVGLCALLLLAMAAAAGVVMWPIDAGPYLRGESSGEMRDRSGRLLAAFLNGDEQWRFRRSLGEIGPRLIDATIAVEDQRFRRHRGVDLLAVARAAWQNVTRRRVVSGASTITMQVVKLHDGPARSLWAKGWQAVRAARLERSASKDEILEAYLNGAPYGLNLVGCEAAARRYFGKPALELSLAEAALLAGLPKAPTALSPLKRPARAQARRDHVLARMCEEGSISDDELRRALASDLGAQWRAFPMLAPHLAMGLKERAAREGVVRTTLDGDTQREAERFVREHVSRLDGQERGAQDGSAGVGAGARTASVRRLNAALIAVEAPTVRVLARVGSADFFNVAGGGQVDTCRARRSPGSTLKPFTYGLAMDRQRLYRCETLLDAPLDYGLFNPENFDRRYRGTVSASDALRDSLNVPAVTVLERVGFDAAHAFLQDMGLTTLRRAPEHYGLGLTLGSCEARLDELVAAYCAIANLGALQPLRTVVDEGADTRPPDPVQRLSRGACLNLYRMLEQPLPDEMGDDGPPRVDVASRVCWKTGTSTGHHDAWAFVFNRQYVVGVWVGHNDGSHDARLVGATAALPLAAAMFRRLPATNAPAWPSAAADLREVEICAVSGLPACEWDTQTRRVLLPRDRYLHRVCDVHHPAPPVTSSSGRNAKADTNREAAIVERWPGSARNWDLANVSPPDAVTPLADLAGAAPAAGVLRDERHEALRILNPCDRAEFVLTGAANGDRVRLTASTDDRGDLHWYLDDRYLGVSSSRRPLLLDLVAGEHKLTCMTPGGLMDQVRFAVASPHGPRLFDH